ncbi:general transcription factor IIF subunit 1-like [Ptychodera flava]|uniref:general transcription factor IIF subunit 1-like n=1 Tax=Ptychodera flava TaxID=63121 RepID=UPI00396A6571
MANTAPRPTGSSVSGLARPGMQAGAQYEEFSVRVAKKSKKKFSVMNFTGGGNIDMAKWQQVKMERENNLREFKTETDTPTYGAGSEFGKERRQEARRKKYGVITKNYNPEDQPWILRHGGKNGKRYKGKREGGITENTSYFIFTQGPDGAFEAHPLDSWYKFSPMINYKTLNAEEAEEEFGRRDKVLNYFSIMVKKRLKDEEGEEGEEAVKETKKKSQSLTILENDEYQGFMSDDDDDDDSDEEKPKKPKKKGGKSKKKKKDSDDEEAIEESDEGDFDGREFDYLSEMSSDEDDKDINSKRHEMKGLDQEISGEDESEEEEEEEQKTETPAEGDGGTPKQLEEEASKKEELSSDSSSESDDSDLDSTEVKSHLFIQSKGSEKKSRKSPAKATQSNSSANSSRSGTPTIAVDGTVTSHTLDSAAGKLLHGKRKGREDGPPAKRAKGSPVDGAGARSGSSDSGITEEMVRRYLKRKPMTTKDLLHKLRAKKTGMNQHEIVQKITDILRKLSPQNIKLKGKSHWFIKEG